MRNWLSFDSWTISCIQDAIKAIGAIPDTTGWIKVREDGLLIELYCIGEGGYSVERLVPWAKMNENKVNQLLWEVGYAKQSLDSIR